MAENMPSAKSSSSLSRNIDHLSDDLLAEIFTRLPFRSTVGCKYTTGTGYFVYDPLTKVSTQIAPSPSWFKDSLYAVGFVCNPDYDHAKDNPTPNRSFRVVVIPSFIRSASMFEVDVFSSDTGKWGQTTVNCPQGFAFAPHWLLSYEYEGWLYFMGRTSIFVFNPYTFDSEILKYPVGADSMNIMSFGYLGSSCGSLRIADIGLNDLKVWELIDTDDWQLLHRTNLTTKLPPQFCANYYKRVGGFHPYDGDIVYLHSYAEGVFVANLRTDKFEAIPGYEKSDISPFKLELPSLPLLLPAPPKPSSG
ncbi:F-box protein [Sesbania bispinosa]|nr:F-box protein [Sesbania bispinosa]